MTAQQALAWFKEELKDGKCSDNCPQCNAYEVAVEALKKQMRKAPYKQESGKEINYYCSSCQHYLGDETEIRLIAIRPAYCDKCGQALDWSDTE